VVLLIDDSFTFERFRIYRNDAAWICELEADMGRLFLIVTLLTAVSCSVGLGEVLPPTVQSEQSTAKHDMELEYQRERMKVIFAEADLRMKAFDQGRYTNWVILTLVSVITAGGFGFSLFLILKASSREGDQPVSDLEVTLQKIRLTSIQTASMVGLTVYLSSLAFLFL
jgi:hypothetical protein